MAETGTHPLRLLIVEDDPGLQKQLRWCFDGYEVLQATDRASAAVLVRRHHPPLVTLDLGLPPDPTNASQGLALLEELLDFAPTTKVIVVTGNDDRENALRAIALGAYDFYLKPVDADLLRLIVDRAARLYDLEAENRHLTRNDANSLHGIITADPGMLEIRRIIERVAPSDATVLLLGDSGTGKELLARAVRDLSHRAGERFVAINCAAIPDALLESELFGYEKGAFTGASQQTLGKIETANNGTLFLDEIGDLPLSLQAKLLRFLQERTVERLGGRTEIPVNVRIVAATNQDLAQLIKTGDFREDLYYRLSEVSVAVPPLRERLGDSVLLAHSLLEQFGREQRSPPRGFTPAAIASIEAHDWPGNVRELQNVVRRAVIMSEGPRITPEDLGLANTQPDQAPLPLRAARDAAEHQAVVRAMAHCNGSIVQAAEILGITRPTLYGLLEKHGLK